MEKTKIEYLLLFSENYWLANTFERSAVTAPGVGLGCVCSNGKYGYCVNDPYANNYLLTSVYSSKMVAHTYGIRPVITLDENVEIKKVVKKTEAV